MTPLSILGIWKNQNFTYLCKNKKLAPMENLDIQFDERGSLMPYEKVNMSLEVFEYNFIHRFENSSTRKAIFEDYEHYLADFQRLVTPNFTQWIDGSFVTKKLNPADIDFVTFIDAAIFEEKERLIVNQFIYPNAPKIYNVDAYGVRVYPVNHPFHNIGISDTLYWQEWFGQTRPNRDKRKFKKGFVQIKFNES
jgi:hypothetical protein